MSNDIINKVIESLLLDRKSMVSAMHYHLRWNEIVNAEKLQIAINNLDNKLIEITKENKDVK